MVKHPLSQHRLNQMVDEASLHVQHLRSMCQNLEQAQRMAMENADNDDVRRASRALAAVKIELREKQEVLKDLECDAEGYFEDPAHAKQPDYSAHLFEQWLEIISPYTCTATSVLSNWHDQ
jgi:hypothetical protein